MKHVVEPILTVLLLQLSEKVWKNRGPYSCNRNWRSESVTLPVECKSDTANFEQECSGVIAFAERPHRIAAPTYINSSSRPRLHCCEFGWIMKGVLYLGTFCLYLCLSVCDHVVFWQIAKYESFSVNWLVPTQEWLLLCIVKSSACSMTLLPIHDYDPISKKLWFGLWFHQV